MRKDLVDRRSWLEGVALNTEGTQVANRGDHLPQWSEGVPGLNASLLSTNISWAPLHGWECPVGSLLVLVLSVQACWG